MVVSRWGARFLGRRFPCSIGRGGTTFDKREGDGASPVGTWHLVMGGHRPDRTPAPTTIVPLAKIGPTDIWSDDPNDADYNQWLTRRDHPHAHERLRRADPLYDLVLMSDWNWPNAQPGRGSAIFVHAWRRPRYPTAGCVAFRPDNLLWIARHWTPGSRLILRGQP